MKFRLPILALALLLTSGCAAVITSPAPEEPRAVFVLEHGRHTSLVLVNRDGKPVRYAFGEHLWYAHNQTGFFRGMSALLAPTPGTLGRRVLDVEPRRSAIRTGVGVPIEFIHCIAAPMDRVDRLGRWLDKVFDDNIETLHDNPGMNMEFVAVPENYWFGRNSNNAVARWLERLEADVTGTTTFANWRVVYPEDTIPEVCREDLGS